MRENPAPQPDPTDLHLMRRALLAAKEAAGKGEVPVGAVVARGEEVLAVAANEREATKDPTAHAELLAIRRAARTLGGGLPAAPSMLPWNRVPCAPALPTQHA
jgi:tRNA(adenine34) deaminase